MEGPDNQVGSALQRIDSGRGGWRLPALLVAGLLIGLVVVARLGMKPEPPSTGLAPTLRPAATQTAEPSRPTPPSATPTAEPRPPLDGVQLGPGPSQVWAGRYADGIPLQIHDIAVRRVEDVLGRTPSGTVLVGGWYVGPSCGRLGRVGYCPYGTMVDNPADLGDAARSLRLSGVVVPVDRAGPAVFRGAIEINCLKECHTTLAVEAALWLGDPLTDTGPIAVLPLLSSLSYAFPGLTATPVHERRDCPILPPAQAYRLSGAGVHAALVYPTVADREAAGHGKRIGRRVMPIEEDGECLPPLPNSDATWIVEDNVMLLVASGRPLTSELARAALADARAQSADDGPTEAAPITTWQALSRFWRAYPTLVVVPGEQPIAATELPPTTWLWAGSDLRVLAVFPDRRARRAVDISALPRSLGDGLPRRNLSLRWIGVANVLLGMVGRPEFDEHVRELLRENIP